MHIEATVSGVIRHILVKPGDSVAVDQEVAIIESMKMEIPVAAERGGTVDAVLVAVDELVAEGQTLVTLR